VTDVQRSAGHSGEQVDPYAACAARCSLVRANTSMPSTISFAFGSLPSLCVP
jgi:hypothetical protein